jgi:hypothetical protein
MVVLPPNASNAAIAEEYLHIMAAKARGWVGAMPPRNLVEEVVVEREVLAHAGPLGMTTPQVSSLQGVLQRYIDDLVKQYDIHM